MIAAADVTRAFRVLVPPPVRCRTHLDPRTEDFTVTLAKMAAVHLGLATETGRAYVAGVLSRELAAAVAIPDVPRVRGQCAFVIVRPAVTP